MSPPVRMPGIPPATARLVRAARQAARAMRRLGAHVDQANRAAETLLEDLREPRYVEVAPGRAHRLTVEGVDLAGAGEYTTLIVDEAAELSPETLDDLVDRMADGRTRVVRRRR